MKKFVVLLIILAAAISPVFSQYDTIPEHGSISGNVWDANTGLSIIGAPVVAHGPNWDDTTFTDSAGAYQITELEPGLYSVYASASGYGTATICSVIVFAGQNTPNINFWLVPSGGPEYGSISGFVKDGSTGLPIIGAYVTAQGPGYGSAHTDSTGNYRITSLEPGSYVVTASGSGYESATICSVIVFEGQNTSEINFWLEPGGPEHGSISGNVWDANTGLSIIGAPVVAHGPNWDDTTFTDSAGAYQITELEPGLYSVYASASGYGTATICSVIVFAGQDTPNINFWLVPSGGPEYGSISGFVKDDSTGLPIVGAHIIAQGSGWGDTYSDSGGIYQITNLVEGWYVVEATAPGYEPGLQCSVIVFAGQNTPDVNFWLHPSGGASTGISGCVTNAYNNQPILGALVTALGPPGSSGGEANTNFYGDYFIQDLSPGFYIVRASAMGFEQSVYPESVKVVEGQITTDIDFALVPLDTFELGGISGIITDATNGLPIPFAQVFALNPYGQGQAYSDSVGVYLINGLTEGPYVVRATASGYYPATYPESVWVNVGQITSDIDFALTPSDTGGIAGFVLDGETGQTISGAKIIATVSTDTFQVETNSLGDYLVDDLQHGIYHIDIQAPGYEPISYLEAILVQSGEIKSFISPVLYPTSSIEEQRPSNANRISLRIYPCPFTNSLQISFQVNKHTNVQLRVFDVTGRIVRGLLDSSIKPGYYSVTWNGKDNFNRTLPKGVYFCEFATDDTRIIRKTILVK